MRHEAWAVCSSSRDRGRDAGCGKEVWQTYGRRRHDGSRRWGRGVGIRDRIRWMMDKYDVVGDVGSWRPWKKYSRLKCNRGEMRLENVSKGGECKIGWLAVDGGSAKMQFHTKCCGDLSSGCRSNSGDRSGVGRGGGERKRRSREQRAVHEPPSPTVACLLAGLPAQSANLSLSKLPANWYDAAYSSVGYLIQGLSLPEPLHLPAWKRESPAHPYLP